MSVIRTTRYQSDAAVEEILARRTAVISAVRAQYPGLIQARLTRLEDGTWVDHWVWDSAEHMQAASAGAPNIPEAGAAFAITSDATAETAEIVDES
jgi:hypothetical protein